MKSTAILPLLPKRAHGDFAEFWREGMISRDVYFAGGAMRHLLTGEDPKDYDLFFRDTGEQWRDGVKQSREVLSSRGYVVKFACPEGKLFTYALPEPESDAFTRKVQLIAERPFADLETLVDSFDLGPCIAGTDGETMVFHREFVRGTSQARLKLHRLTYPVATMNRIVKYLKRGYEKDSIMEEFVRAVAEGAPWGDESMRRYID